MPAYEGELVGYSLPTVTIKAADGSIHTHICHHNCECQLDDQVLGLRDLQLGDHLSVSGCPATSLKVMRTEEQQPTAQVHSQHPPAAHQQPVAAPPVSTEEGVEKEENPTPPEGPKHKVRRKGPLG